MITESLPAPSKVQRRVEQHEIGSMLRQVTREYGIPGHKYDDLATAISREFDVICLASDIRSYERLHVEDYELESRRHNYALQSGFRKMLWA